MGKLRWLEVLNFGFDFFSINCPALTQAIPPARGHTPDPVQTHRPAQQWPHSARHRCLSNICGDPEFPLFPWADGVSSVPACWTLAWSRSPRRPPSPPGPACWGPDSWWPPPSTPSPCVWPPASAAGPSGPEPEPGPARYSLKTHQHSSQHITRINTVTRYHRRHTLTSLINATSFLVVFVTELFLRRAAVSLSAC